VVDAGNVSLPTAVRHGLVGLLCSLLNLAIVHGTDVWLRAPYLLGLAATCVITIPLSYFLHRSVTFRSAHPASLPEAGRFAVQQLAQFGVGVVLTILAVEVLTFTPTLAFGLATLVLWSFAFLSQAVWVFRAGPHAASRRDAA